MRLNNSRKSRNIEDRRGQRMNIGGRGGKIGLGTIVLALVAMYFGVDPSIVLQNVGGPVVTETRTQPPAATPESEFVSKVLADTEDAWAGIFQQKGWGAYQEPRLVLFNGATPTACGTGQSAMGPFYCPADRKVYLDLGFFQQMAQELNSPGDFAQAYVVAHEVAHHVQNLLGVMEQVDQLRRGASTTAANQLSVRVELQADCFSGVWANHSDSQRNTLEPGDIEEGLNAASAIGDDALQKRSQGYVVPDSFTHGTSAQRVRWFKRGFDSGDPAQCDTFGASSL
ncbi:neutral zinc metallopeptidase [Pusillimonas sp. MFBS29]|uniref:KPN_02809 family neutral zinc metallopeptidase n=1 Tax=Pusillimonas sp. MFBS29 TaxID=2886690 RepID=UPI001D12CA5C|nr:neutral zinc metallopeptidase [Pusillimonas sp. MFBS29]MCC2596600.1 neutral zinc metallopeptidase [Pusillimonas sp. MFBS29]